MKGMKQDSVLACGMELVRVLTGIFFFLSSEIGKGV